MDYEKVLYKHFGQVKDFTLGVSIAKYFYQMGTEQKESVSEDLEEAANKYADKHPTCGLAKQSFKAGAQWNKQQMMKDAVERVVKVDAGGYPYIDVTIELYDYDKDEPLAKKGDKVKLIIVSNTK